MQAVSVCVWTIAERSSSASAAIEFNTGPRWRALDKPMERPCSDSSSSVETIVVIVIAFLVLAVSFAARAIIGLGMEEWSNEFSWSRSAISSGGSVALVMMAITVPLAGLAADRWGARVVLALGCGLLCCGLVMIGTMTGYWQFMVGYGALCGVGFGLASLPVVGSLIVKTVRDKQGLATGIATSGTTGGQLVIVPALAFLFPMIGWRAGLIGFAVLSCFIGLFSLGRLERNAGRPESLGKADPDTVLDRLKPVVGSLAFHGLFWSFALCGFTATGIVETHLIPFAQVCGFSIAARTGAYGVFALFNLIGIITAGFLADRMDRRLLLVMIYLLRSLAFVVPIFAGTNYPLLLAFSASVGIAFYATFPATIGLSAAHFGTTNLGLVVGMLTVGHSLGAAAGAWFGGYVYDLFFRYDIMWFGAIALALMSAVLASLVDDPRSLDSAQSSEAASTGAPLVHS